MTTRPSITWSGQRAGIRRSEVVQRCAGDPWKKTHCPQFALDHDPVRYCYGGTSLQPRPVNTVLDYQHEELQRTVLLLFAQNETDGKSVEDVARTLL